MKYFRLQLFVDLVISSPSLRIGVKQSHKVIFYFFLPFQEVPLSALSKEIAYGELRIIHRRRVTEVMAVFLRRDRVWGDSKDELRKVNIGT